MAVGMGRYNHLQRHKNSQKSIILRMHKHDFCGGAKYLHTRNIGEKNKM